ncbi:VOC family protein [Nocardioides nitrophenolicus]|uniref:VOC family protein n=1 Tax=Nocardioides nitrophenolicus TaxID=60489 RepID=UPI00195A8D27|nr:VOC family protein [Nocardioides nitrophenolicus]MBM7517629.1 catechol 2,3-dioxygenase-like lactoylglutathione lyase family enzyme [Nocardioides nitrophenolicus]
MTSGPTTTPRTGFGPVTQLAWVTDDLDATERALGATLGAVGWTRLPGIHFGPDACTLRGEPADFTADISLSYAGDLQLELIRPVAGASMYAEFLAERGPGLHHVCCEVASMDEALARAEAEGFAVVQAGAMAGGLMRFAYLDTAAAGASYVELAEVSPALREMFAQIKERSGRDPR